jgi:hypothetical protein
MSTERLLALVTFGLSAALLIRMTPGAIGAWRVYTGTGARRQEDATGQAPLPSPELAGRMGDLAAVGYREIGETRLVLPDDELFAWIMAADDAASYAILVESRILAPGMTGLYSAWPDGTWLGTLHPRGDPMERAGLHLRVARDSLIEAVRSHRTALDGLRRAHGQPRRIERMVDMLALDADYRRRFGGRELRPQVVRILFPVALAVAVTAISIVLVVALPR